MICSKTKLAHEFEFIKTIPIIIYPEGIVSDIFQNKSNKFALNARLGPQKFPVYLKLLWLGNNSTTV